jgi:hypothetical protein
VNENLGELPRGPMQGRNTIGEVTESLHRFLLDGWKSDAPPPRIEEDLSFVPKDREEVVYVYMYKATQNTSLMNTKRFRMARFTATNHEGGVLDPKEMYWERPPLYIELHYLIAVHSKFRSDAERLLGWLLLRLHEATHLLYRPRRYLLPDGRAVDSTGAAWKPDNTGDSVIMEKVALALVDDLTVGDAINFFTIHEAPFRPYLTYKARCALEGSLVAGMPHAGDIEFAQEAMEPPRPAGQPANRESASGRMRAAPTRRITDIQPGDDDSSR